MDKSRPGKLSSLIESLKMAGKYVFDKRKSWLIRCRGCVCVAVTTRAQTSKLTAANKAKSVKSGIDRTEFKLSSIFCVQTYIKFCLQMAVGRDQLNLLRIVEWMCKADVHTNFVNKEKERGKGGKEWEQNRKHIPESEIQTCTFFSNRHPAAGIDAKKRFSTLVSLHRELGKLTAFSQIGFICDKFATGGMKYSRI